MVTSVNAKDAEARVREIIGEAHDKLMELSKELYTGEYDYSRIPEIGIPIGSDGAYPDQSPQAKAEVRFQIDIRLAHN